MVDVKKRCNAIALFSQSYSVLRQLDTGFLSLPRIDLLPICNVPDRMVGSSNGAAEFELENNQERQVRAINLGSGA